MNTIREYREKGMADERAGLPLLVEGTPRQVAEYIEGRQLEEHRRRIRTED